MSQVQVDVNLTGAAQVNAGLSSIQDKINQLNATLGGGGGGARSPGGNPIFSSSLFGASNLLQGLGLNQLGHFVRAIGLLGGNGPGGLGAVISNLGAMVPAIANASFALGGITIAGEIVKKTFEAISFTAGEMITSVTTLGKARSLEGMMVESGETERIAAQISANVVGGMTTPAVLGMLKKASSGTEFSVKEMGELFSAYKAKTGEINTIDQMHDFAAQFARVSGLDPKEAGTFLGRLKSETGASNEGVMNTASSLWGMGIAGSAELGDAGMLSKAFTFAPKLSATSEGGMDTIMALFQGINMQKQMPGPSAVATKNILEDMFEDKGGAISGALGHKTTMIGANGLREFTKFTDDFIDLALMFNNKNQRVKGVKQTSREGFEMFLSGAAEKGVDLSGDLNSQKQALQDYISSLEAAGKSTKDVASESDRLGSTAMVELQTSFNNLSNELSGGFLESLKVLSPYMDELSNIIISHKDDIAEGLSQFAFYLGNLITFLPATINAIVNFMNFFMKIANWVTGGPANPEEGLARAQSDLEDSRKRYKEKNDDPNATAADRNDVAKDLAKHERDVEDAKKVVVATMSGDLKQQFEEEEKNRRNIAQGNVNQTDIPGYELTSHPLTEEEHQKQTDRVISKLDELKTNKDDKSPGSPPAVNPHGRGAKDLMTPFSNQSQQ